MHETAEEYRKRLMAQLEGQDALATQAATADKLRRLLRGVGDDHLHRQPRPGAWSPAQVLAHLADCEIVYGYRIRMILCTPGVVIQAFDQDRWAEEMAYQQRPAAASLAAFAAAREHNLQLLRSLRADQWQQYGEHSERGPETIEMIAAMLAGHDLNHLRQIEERLPKASDSTQAKSRPQLKSVSPARATSSRKAARRP